jgi:hypothetical protein
MAMPLKYSFQFSIPIMLHCLLCRDREKRGEKINWLHNTNAQTSKEKFIEEAWKHLSIQIPSFDMRGGGAHQGVTDEDNG